MDSAQKSQAVGLMVPTVNDGAVPSDMKNRARGERILAPSRFTLQRVCEAESVARHRLRGHEVHADGCPYFVRRAFDVDDLESEGGR